MGLIEDLRALKKGNEVTFLSFLQKLTKNEPAIHVFYEGKNDHGFYEASLRRELSDKAKLKTYVCGNKKEVFKTRERLKIRDYDDSLIFMVDKDIDDIIPVNYEEGEDVFVTDVYSIENYLVNNKAFEQLTSVGLKINLGDEQLDYLVRKFEHANSAFCSGISQTMAWLLCCRRQGLKVNLKNIKLTDIIDITDDLDVNVKISGVDLLSYLHEKSNADGEVLLGSFQDAKIELAEFPFEKYVRGKFHLWFLLRFYEKSKLVLEKANGNRIKTHFNMNEFTIIDFLAPRIDTPARLKNFYRSTCPEELIT